MLPFKQFITYIAVKTTCFALMYLPPGGHQRLKEHIELLSTVEVYSCSSKSLCLQWYLNMEACRALKELEKHVVNV